MRATGYIINGKRRPVAYPVENYLDNPALMLHVGKGGDGADLGENRGDGADVDKIIAHTTKGEMGIVLPGRGKVRNDGERVNRYWSGSEKQSGTQIVIDCDTSVECLCDLGRVAAHGASDRIVNQNSVQFELYQEWDPVLKKFVLYEEQLDRAVEVCDDLTRIFGIQRQTPHGYGGHPIPRLDAGGRDMVGVFGHCHVTRTRGPGDPGPQFFAKLKAAGYETPNFETGEDLMIWRARQAQLGCQITGRPYADTVRALSKHGRRWGQWVRRPGD